MHANVAFDIAHRQVGLPAMLTGVQIRAARAMLKWSAQDLAGRCGLSYAAIQRAEQAEGMPNMQSRNLATIKTTFEAAGILFLDAGDRRDGGIGLRFRDE